MKSKGFSVLNTLSKPNKSAIRSATASIYWHIKSLFIPIKSTGNAAVTNSFSKDTDSQTGGQICLDMEVTKESVKIYITDNGTGLPSELLDRITEPYVTTRQKGTGLGLAIAKKIMEDHNGDLILVNNEGTGAKAIMMFNKSDFES